jgi:putative DNA-invertase from lambdoid prophage Rac
MAGLLSLFAEFEHEILRERIRAGIAEARLKGKRFGRPLTVGKKAAQIRKLYRSGVSKDRPPPRSAVPLFAGSGKSGRRLRQ